MRPLNGRTCWVPVVPSGESEADEFGARGTLHPGQPRSDKRTSPTPRTPAVFSFGARMATFRYLKWRTPSRLRAAVISPRPATFCRTFLCRPDRMSAVLCERQAPGYRAHAAHPDNDPGAANSTRPLGLESLSIGFRLPLIGGFYPGANDAGRLARPGRFIVAFSQITASIRPLRPLSALLTPAWSLPASTWTSSRAATV